MDRSVVAGGGRDQVIDIAVFDPIPIFRFGLVAALGFGGTELATEDEVVEWIEARSGVLFYTVLDGADGLPRHLGHSDSIGIVAVLETFTTARAAHMLRVGAANVVDRTAQTAEFRRVVAETRAGRITVSAAVLKAALAAPPSTSNRSNVSDEELSWLRDLASGLGVSAIAGRARFSERMMYRKLRLLYRRLGAANRTQALMIARDEGWV